MTLLGRYSINWAKDPSESTLEVFTMTVLLPKGGPVENRLVAAMTLQVKHGFQFKALWIHLHLTY